MQQLDHIAQLLRSPGATPCQLFGKAAVTQARQIPRQNQTPHQAELGLAQLLLSSKLGILLACSICIFLFYLIWSICNVCDQYLKMASLGLPWWSEILCSQYWGPRFNPWLGTWIPHDATEDPTCHNKGQRSHVLQLRANAAKLIN